MRLNGSIISLSAIYRVLINQITCLRGPAHEPVHPQRRRATTRAGWPRRRAGGVRNPARATPPRLRGAVDADHRPARRRKDRALGSVREQSTRKRLGHRHGRDHQERGLRVAHGQHGPARALSGCTQSELDRQAPPGRRRPQVILDHRRSRRLGHGRHRHRAARRHRRQRPPRRRPHRSACRGWRSRPGTRNRDRVPRRRSSVPARERV